MELYLGQSMELKLSESRVGDGGDRSSSTFGGLLSFQKFSNAEPCKAFCLPLHLNRFLRASSLNSVSQLFNFNPYTTEPA